MSKHKCDTCSHQKCDTCGNHHSPYFERKTDFDWGCAFYAEKQPLSPTAEIRVVFTRGGTGVILDFTLLSGSDHLLNGAARQCIMSLRQTAVDNGAREG